MAVPQLLQDIIRVLLALATPAALVALVLAGIALRREGGTTFWIGGGFSRWIFWAIVLLTIPQLLSWFSFFGVGVPLPSGGIGTGWLASFRADVVTFVQDFVIGRLAPVLAAFFVLRAVLDTADGGTPLPSILTAMFLLAAPHTLSLFESWNTGGRFATADILDSLWTYLASQILPVAAGLAIIGAMINFAMHRPALRLVAVSAGFLTVSALWRLVLSMM